MFSLLLPAMGADGFMGTAEDSSRIERFLAVLLRSPNAVLFAASFRPPVGAMVWIFPDDLSRWWKDCRVSGAAFLAPIAWKARRRWGWHYEKDGLDYLALKVWTGPETRNKIRRKTTGKGGRREENIT